MSQDQSEQDQRELIISNLTNFCVAWINIQRNIQGLMDFILSNHNAMQTLAYIQHITNKEDFPNYAEFNTTELSGKLLDAIISDALGGDNIKQFEQIPDFIQSTIRTFVYGDKNSVSSENLIDEVRSTLLKNLQKLQKDQLQEGETIALDLSGNIFPLNKFDEKTPTALIGDIPIDFIREFIRDLLVRGKELRGYREQANQAIQAIVAIENWQEVLSETPRTAVSNVTTEAQESVQSPNQPSV